ncbi:MAG: CDP-diacylglycerol--serine O-phosphatidyltransferase [Owenweeksia sp.]
MKSFIPNALTLANLACGLLAITSIFSGSFINAAWLVGFSLVFDFLDGFMARLLRVHSELGKQLDSLADLVTFGVAPGFMMFKLFRIAMQGGEPIPEFLPYLALLIPLFSALRLAKFNIDTRQAEYFIGLPTPANAIFIFSVAYIALYGSSDTMQDVLLHPLFLTAITVLTSFLLVAELPLMSLKVKSASWRENRERIILLAGIGLLLVIFRFRALLFIIPLYLILSLIFKPHNK